MKKQYIMSVALTLSLSFSVTAQKNYTLEDCVNYAAKNNIQLQQSQLGIQQSELNIKQNKSLTLPQVNGASTVAVNLGRSVDPTTNTFETRTILSNNFQVSASQTIYNGGAIKSGIRQSYTDKAAAEADAAQALNNLALSIAQAYLQLLLAQENLSIVQTRRSESLKQLERIEKLIGAGATPSGARYDFEAQIARDEQTITAAQNAIDIAYLNLRQLMNMPLTEEFKVITPTLTLTDSNELLDINQLYLEAVNNQPNIKAAEMRKQSASIGVEIAEARKLPTIRAFGQTSTNFSSIAKKITGYEPASRYLGDLDINGQLVPLNLISQQPILGSDPYFNQIGENISQAIGVSLNVPIYSAGQNKIAVQRAELGIVSADLQGEQLRRQLLSDIQRAVADVKAAKLQYQANLKTQTAFENSLRNARKRFDAGAGTTFELTTAQNNLDNAKTNLLISKYDYLFKQKVVDFYRGIPIKID